MRAVRIIEAGADVRSAFAKNPSSRPYPAGFRAAADARWSRGLIALVRLLRGDYPTGYAFLVISAVATLIALVEPRVNFPRSACVAARIGQRTIWPHDAVALNRAAAISLP
jgi:hypothetical protein